MIEKVKINQSNTCLDLVLKQAYHVADAWEERENHREDYFFNQHSNCQKT